MPASLDDGWIVTSPENVGMDNARLCAIEDRLKLLGSSRGLLNRGSLLGRTLSESLTGAA